MIRKIGILSIGICCLILMFSCEEDLNNIGSNVIKNTKFDTNEIELDIEITPVSIDAVRADNIILGNAMNEFWLGVYNSKNYKTLEASFVSQLNLASGLRTDDVEAASEDFPIDSIYTLDKVVLRLPYNATSKSDSEGKQLFVLDSVLGNPNIATSIKVFRSGTYLSRLDPTNPSQLNSYLSNESYIEEELLSTPDFSFKPLSTDTILKVTRTKVTDFISGASETFESKEKLSTNGPFLTIPLNTNRMKELFWDKFSNSEFSSTEEFKNYFRGIYVKAEGNDGSLLPFNLSSISPTAAVEFYYTISRFEKTEGNSSLVYKDTVPSKYSFPLSGIRTSVYQTSSATNATPNDNFVIQGTAGTMAEIKILGVNLTKLKQDDPNNNILKYEEFDNDPKDNYLSLKELASSRDLSNERYGFLVNDAFLTFYVNQAVNTNKDIVPQRLFVYTNEDDGNGVLSPKHIVDFTERQVFKNGNLELSSDNQPEKYSIKVTKHISNLLNGDSGNTPPFVLRAYNNPTDNPFLNNSLNINVNAYNWNPRGVTLFNQNESTHGSKKAVLKLTYSEKK